jgi:hypothetical protein
MDEKNLRLITIGLVVLLAASGITVFFILRAGDKKPSSDAIRVACVGDSLTQSSEYPYYLWNLLGTENYALRNFGAGATTVLLNSETPYMNTSVFQDALDFQPDIVIIMLEPMTLSQAFTRTTRVLLATTWSWLSRSKILQATPKYGLCCLHRFSAIKVAKQALHTSRTP